MRSNTRTGRPWRASTAAVSKPAAEPPTTAIFWLFARGVGWETLCASRDSSAIVCFCDLPHELGISDFENRRVPSGPFQDSGFTSRCPPRLSHNGTRIISQRTSHPKAKGARNAEIIQEAEVGLGSLTWRSYGSPSRTKTAANAPSTSSPITVYVVPAEKFGINRAIVPQTIAPTYIAKTAPR